MKQRSRVHSSWALLGIAWAMVGCSQRPPPTVGAPVVKAPPTVAPTVVKAAGAMVVDTDSAWGDLQGRFVLDGEIPPRKPLDTDKDEVCRANPQVDESLLVDEKSRGIANVLVWLASPQDHQVTIDPDVTAKIPAEVKLTIKGCRFEPRMLTVTTRQTVLVTNTDAIGHNATLGVFRNRGESRLAASNGVLDWNFPFAELGPIPLTCPIHPWMSAHLLILDHPYAAVTDKNGAFVIKNLPAGERRFRFWHERSGNIREVTLGGKTEQWERGTRTVEILSGTKDLGEIHLAADRLQSDRK